MLKAALHNLGCKVNAYETEAMQTLLEEAGYEIVDFHDKADVYVINTCSVTNIADRKSRQMLHQAKKRNPESIVVACGCYVQTSPQKAAQDESIDVVIGNNQKYRLPEILADYLQNGQKLTEIPDIGKDKQYEQMRMKKTAEHTRAFVKVQDGCNQFCTYCIIPYARGRVRSREYNEVIDEIRELAKNGYQEVVLTGIHLTSYGKDVDSTLIDLIEGVAAVDGIKRVRLGSLEPGIVTEEFAKRLSKIEAFCPHFHLSLQSGCDATLKRMNRHYTAKEYLDGCTLLRKYFEHPAITTDVIVGFPGETEEEFEQTRAFLQKVDFYEVHLFKYSKRQGTPAATMPNQLTEKQKAQRSHILAEDLKANKRRFMEYYRNQNVEILVEEKEQIGNKFFYTGYTKEYVKVAIPGIACKEETNCFVTVKLTNFLDEDIMGVL
ncbi:MAG: tRNA (N(6)-L-threonylcarbamoyladenosine(37)-C(2))-methylthiotransferase MtaB [Lachnospiraceae bacterium]|jgi:threonylcarbamoyladenosine tRNA methylthiotransferase MtaB|nr:tRNA (N(6)-L-threonylcarbamoyladenosine(37)-C(2))-methylthiotransferase MtaB [Lachnospiraceae bacterium]